MTDPKPEKRQDYICPIRFHNPLPQVPSEQRLLAYPFAPDKFTKYQLTSLEAEYQHRLLTSLDMGLQIDLINPDVYAKGKGEEVLPDDDELFENPRKEIPVLREKKRKGTGNYLRKSKLPNFGPTSHSEPQEKTAIAEEELDLDPSTLIPKIEESFEFKEFVHPLKPHMKVAKVYDVVPDLSNIARDYTLLSFDEEPLEFDASLTVLKEHEDEEGDSILALYSNPTPGPVEDHVNLNYVRNYKYSHSGEPGQKDILLWMDPETDVVMYAMVEFKMSLKKKKVPKGIVTPNDVNLPKTSLKVTFRKEKKEELIRKRAKLLDYECQIPADIDKEIQEVDETEDVEVVENKQLIAELFGDDEEDVGKSED